MSFRTLHAIVQWLMDAAAAAKEIVFSRKVKILLLMEFILGHTLGQRSKMVKFAAIITRTSAFRMLLINALLIRCFSGGA